MKTPQTSSVSSPDDDEGRASVFDVAFPEYEERPRRRIGSGLAWATVAEAFEPFVREHLKQREAAPQAYREKYRILENKRFEM